jgi:hypothetical protein
MELEPGVNWGCVAAELPEGTLNRSLSTSHSKVASFAALRAAGVPIPTWTENAHVARDWGCKFLARRDYLSGGRGIKILEAGQLLVAPQAELPHFFTKFLLHRREARLHCWRGEIICEQVRLLPPGCSNPIHSYENGCTYKSLGSGQLETYLGSSEAGLARDYAIRATTGVGLDFGAVDLFLTRAGRLVVLEVNSAPGLRSPATLNAYKERLLSLSRRRINR